MDGSLQIDRRHAVQNSKNSYRCETNANFNIPDELEHYSRRSPDVRPLSLDAASNMHAGADKIPEESQQWLHRSLASPLRGSLSSQEKPRVANDTGLKMVGDSDVAEQNEIAGLEASGYMRTFQNPPDARHMSGLDVLGRRRSQSIGSGPRGSKIAALSVQLRTRLSYAAAKIEKKRHSQTQNQLPTGLLQKNSSTPVLRVETLSQAGQPLSIDDLEYQRVAANGSPNGSTVSAPDAPATSNPHPLEARAQPTLASITSDLYPQPQSDPQKHFRRSSSEQAGPLRLAPSADTGPNRLSGQRRRPNPNIPSVSRYEPFPRHGRHRSQHEFQTDSDVDRVPETPPLRHSTLSNLSQYNGLSENSQSSSMEQDAIETLLFMSSPGTSGYHTNSQNSQRNQDVRSVDNNVSQSSQLQYIDASQTSGHSDLPSNRATQAGDDIDRILDQMNSDSDDDANYTSGRPDRAENVSRAIVR
ncbi:uncharacterized protein BDV17DRAFT_107044 [Aspergillus undulatus]|uniref:uncharacterized protein n=1 Tax=Aspergillus undulatus TaxID=1810928 RepID=UPI003CCCD4E1